MTTRSDSSAVPDWNPLREVQSLTGVMIWRVMIWGVTPFLAFLVALAVRAGRATDWIWMEVVWHAFFVAMHFPVKRKRPDRLGVLGLVWAIGIVILAQGQWGPQVGLGMAWMGIAVMAQFFLGGRAAVVVVFLFAAVFLGEGAAIAFGWIAPPDPTFFDLTLTSNWIRLAISGTLSITVLAILFRYMQDALEAAIKNEFREREARHAAQATAEASQRMEALGRLAAGVTHDVNNVLTVILAASEEIQSISDDGEVRNLAEEMSQTAHGAAETTRQLLALGRGQGASISTVDPEELVDWVVRAPRRLLPANVALHATATTSRRMSGDPALLQQAILNLVLNARDAMPEGGEVHVTVGDASGTEGRPAPQVQITVSDNGGGIPAANLDRIFEPFFTTKRIGEGTGLGLSMVRNSIEGMGGVITVDSAPGVGTTFRIFLPVAPPFAVADIPRPAKHGRATVLLVEARGDVRGILAGALRRAHYVVHESESVAGALRLLTALRDRRALPHLVSTDAELTDGSVTPLLEWLATGAEDTRVLLHGIPDASARAQIERGHYLFLPKPFAASQLLEAVDAALSPTRLN